MVFKKKFLVGVLTFFVFMLLFAGVFGSIWLFGKSFSNQAVVKEETPLPTKDFLEPSQVLNNKSEYANQRLNLRGRVVLEPVVCQKKDCPANDACCGCPDTRDLLLVDATATILSGRTKNRLRLLDEDKNSFCQRKASSCEYDCRHWQVDSRYDVAGIFFAEPPPPAWQMSLDFYFQVRHEQFLGRVSGVAALVEQFQNLASDLVFRIKNINRSGFYLLH